MKLLVIGGTRFVGHHLVQAALARGDTVTLFNRGQSGPAPAGVEQRSGDRRTDLSALNAGAWDAVIDTCAYLPREVHAMAAKLHGRVARYLLVSTVSVYASAAAPNHEASPLGALADPSTEVVDGDSYGPLKALCEAALLSVFGAQALVARPGLIVAPRLPARGHPPRRRRRPAHPAAGADRGRHAGLVPRPAARAAGV